MVTNRTKETKLEKIAGAVAGATFWAATASPLVCLYLGKPDLAIPTMIGGYALSGAVALLVEANETQKRIDSDRAYSS